jgi:hypothetical protein
MLSNSPTGPLSNVLLMAAEDNCLIARTRLRAGDLIDIDGVQVTLKQTIEIGHKLARRDLAAGEKIYRYGAPIGTIAKPVAIGEHIHTHNLESDYIPTYTLTAEGHHFFDKVKHD